MGVTFSEESAADLEAKNAMSEAKIVDGYIPSMGHAVRRVSSDGTSSVVYRVIAPYVDSGGDKRLICISTVDDADVHSFPADSFSHKWVRIPAMDKLSIVPNDIIKYTYLERTSRKRMEDVIVRINSVLEGLVKTLSDNEKLRAFDNETIGLMRQLAGELIFIITEGAVAPSIMQRD